MAKRGNIKKTKSGKNNNNNNNNNKKTESRKIKNLKNEKWNKSLNSKQTFNRASSSIVPNFNSSYKLKTEIRRILYLLYQHN